MNQDYEQLLFIEISFPFLFIVEFVYAQVYCTLVYITSGRLCEYSN